MGTAAQDMHAEKKIAKAAKVKKGGEKKLKAMDLQATSADIWDTKYRLKDKSGNSVDEQLHDTFERVASAISGVEQTDQLREHWYGRFVWALDNGALPAGRIISNAGAQAYKPATSTINCTVSGTITDSMNDILNKNHEAGMTLKAGCGIGYEFSTLRPKGAYVSGAGAYTSGPLSFMDIFDKMCFTVSSAGGRRGAQMATFDISHPDVMEFIRAKREDGRLRQFNLSLLITSDFIEAVKNDADWPLSFPITEKEAKEDKIDVFTSSRIIWRRYPVDDGYIKNDQGLTACRIFNTIPANRLWNVIMASTYDFAEPGFILVDEVNNKNNNWFDENIRATNPCVTADTWVQTNKGAQQVSDLIGEKFTAIVDGQSHLSAGEGFFKTATKAVVKLKTDEGYQLSLTHDHRVRRVSKFTRYSTDTQWCKVGDLQAGDRVLLNDHRKLKHWQGKYSEDQGYLVGLLLGDGTLKSEAAVLSVWQAAVAVGSNGDCISPGVSSVMSKALSAAQAMLHRSDFNGWHAVSGRNEYRLKSAALRDMVGELGMKPGDKTVKPELEKTSSEFYQGFLRGLFDADGSVQGTQTKGVSVRLSQSNLNTLQTVQRMLLRLGVASKIYKNRRSAGTKMMPNGNGGSAQYTVRAEHELTISGENLQYFSTTIGFVDTDKQARLEKLLNNYKRDLNRERFVARVSAVQEAGVADVYDVRIPGINTFDANGLHAHNCGEQPLPPYGSCLLGSVNLTKFVIDPFTSEAEFDWDKYREVVSVFTRMLDNVVEINGLPLEGQRNEIEYKRRHGMGFLGLGSSATMLGMTYGDDASVEFTEKIACEMAMTGWNQALELAKEKGPAPIMQKEFKVTTEMLSLRPEMIDDGYKAGDTVVGRVLHSKYSRYMQQIAEVDPELVDALVDTGARFTHHSSIAPTGTISLSLANNVSNGIEPSFAHHYARNVIKAGRKTKEKVDVYSYELLAYREVVNENAMPYSEEAENQLPDNFVTSDNISPKQHVDIQAAAQKWVDSSISKTANVPTDYPYEDFKDIYMYAYEKGLKGCTTFRFNPEAFQGVLVKEKDLENTTYQFTLDDGSTIEFKGNEEVEYDGETHTAANLFDALKEGYYGKF